MDSIFVRVDERLGNVGDTLTVEAQLDQKSYQVGEHTFELPEGLSYNVVLTNAGEGILATGMLYAHVVGECDRCLDEATFDLSAEVDEYYLFRAPEEPTYTEDGDEEEEGVDYQLVEQDQIDLSLALNNALVMETPFVVLCQPDCKGLCPTCGCNLNHESCDCGQKRTAEAAEFAEASNPFAALKDLKLDR